MIEHAERYADEFNSAEEIAAAARLRLAERMKRASTGACVVCGALLFGRTDADTCSVKCRVAKFRRGLHM